ncbi:MAG: hypothetical protein LBL04_00975 [Bacteroidales bacterium]|nr:hypothetical protein [Bacteroidales bacterium]
MEVPALGYKNYRNPGNSKKTSVEERYYISSASELDMLPKILPSSGRLLSIFSKKIW